MTYGTSAYGAFIDTGRARENRAAPCSPGRAPGPAGTLPAASVPTVPLPVEFPLLVHVPGDKITPLAASSLSMPKLNLWFFKYIIKAHSHNYKFLFHWSGGLAGA